MQLQENNSVEFCISVNTVRQKMYIRKCVPNLYSLTSCHVLLGLGENFTGVSWELRCPSVYFHHDSRFEKSALFPRRFTFGKRWNCIFRWQLVEVTPICETADTPRPPHVLRNFATTRLVRVVLWRSIILPHFSSTSCYNSTVLMFP